MPTEITSNYFTLTTQNDPQVVTTYITDDGPIHTNMTLPEGASLPPNWVNSFTSPEWHAIDSLSGIKPVQQKKKTIKSKPSSNVILHQNILQMLEDLNIHSINYNLPEMPKDLTYSKEYFMLLKSILWEWKHSPDETAEATEDEL